VKENNIDLVFKNGLGNYEKSPKANSFFEIQKKIKTQKSTQINFNNLSMIVHTLLAISIFISANYIIGKNYLETKNSEFNLKFANKPNFIPQENQTLTSEGYSKEKNSISEDNTSNNLSEGFSKKSEIIKSDIKLISKTKSKKQIFIKKLDPNNLNLENARNSNQNKPDVEKSSNGLSTTNTIKIKNSKGFVGLNFLRFKKKSKRAYELEGLKDSIKIVSGPMNGKVVFDELSGKFNYIPNIGFSGLDSFNYILLNDNGIELNKGTIKIEVEDDGQGFLETDSIFFSNLNKTLSKDDSIKFATIQNQKKNKSF